MSPRIYALCDYTDKKFKIKYAHLKRKKNYQTKIILNKKSVRKTPLLNSWEGQQNHGILKHPHNIK